MAFEKGHVRCGGANVFGVVDAVASCCEYSSVRLCFVGLHVAAETSVSDVLSPVMWDFVLHYEAYCVRPFDSAILQPLRQSSKFVCCQCFPYFFVFGYFRYSPVSGSYTSWILSVGLCRLVFIRLLCEILTLLLFADRKYSFKRALSGVCSAAVFCDFSLVSIGLSIVAVTLDCLFVLTLGVGVSLATLGVGLFRLLLDLACHWPPLELQVAFLVVVWLLI
jgi:hypothetical protein